MFRTCVSSHTYAQEVDYSLIVLWWGKSHALESMSIQKNPNFNFYVTPSMFIK